MKVLRVDHIAFALKEENLERVISLCEKVLGGKYHFTIDVGQGITTAVVQVGDIYFSLETEPADGTGFVAEFLRKRGEGLHHIGLQIDNTDSLKETMIANEIKIPEFSYNGDPEVREDVLIGAKYAPTVLQMMDYKGNPSTTIEEIIGRLRDFYGPRIIKERT